MKALEQYFSVVVFVVFRILVFVQNTELWNTLSCEQLDLITKCHPAVLFGWETSDLATDAISESGIAWAKV